MTRMTRALVGIAMLAVFAVVLAIWMYCGSRAAHVPAPTYVTSTSSGAALQIGQRVFLLSVEAENQVDEILLPDAESYRQLVFAPDGRVLLWQGASELGFAGKIAKFLRMTEAEHAPSADAGLYSCALRNMDCVEFSREVPHFNGAFHLLWLDDLQRLVIADTARHRLLMLDGSGRRVDSIETGLKFPNRPIRHGENVLVPDTDNHRIVEYPVSGWGFGGAVASHSLALEDQHRWPTALLRVKDQWWVLVANHRLAEARIQIYDDQWQKMKTVNLPEEADPVSMVMRDDEVLAADLNGRELWRISSSGNVLGTWSESPLRPYLQSLRTEERRWRHFADVALSLFFGLLPFGFFLAWLIDGKRGSSGPNASSLPEEGGQA